MSEEKLRLPVNPLHVLYALAPIIALGYLAFAVIHDFSKIGDIPPKPAPVPKVVPLPGRPSGPALSPPQRSLVVAGGYPAIIERLRPLHPPPARSRPGMRLVSEADPGQTFAAWRSSGPVTALGARRAIYVQPIGSLDPAERRVVALTVELLELYFGLPVKVLAPLPVGDAWPKEARRADRSWGPDQLQVQYILDSVLAPRVAGDALAVLGLTAHGLWEGDDWTFSYGRTSPEERVAIWTLSRNGELGRDADEQEAYLRRTFKTTVQEIGHMLSIEHCTAYSCAMTGAEDQAAVDKHPLWMCPECEAKLLAATGVDPAWHYERLIAFFRELDMGEEAWFYERSLYAIWGVPGLGETFVPGVSKTPAPPLCAVTP
jgi:archaemetzincin